MVEMPSGVETSCCFGSGGQNGSWLFEQNFVQTPFQIAVWTFVLLLCTENLEPFKVLKNGWESSCVFLKFERKQNVDFNLLCVLLLGVNLSQPTLDCISARFNNKAGNLSFDDFLQIVCRIYSIKGASAIPSYRIMLCRQTDSLTDWPTHWLTSGSTGQLT